MALPESETLKEGWGFVQSWLQHRDTLHRGHMKIFADEPEYCAVTVKRLRTRCSSYAHS